MVFGDGQVHWHAGGAGASGQPQKVPEAYASGELRQLPGTGPLGGCSCDVPVLTSSHHLNLVEGGVGQKNLLLWVRSSY